MREHYKIKKLCKYEVEDFCRLAFFSHSDYEYVCLHYYYYGDMNFSWEHLFVASLYRHFGVCIGTIKFSILRFFLPLSLCIFLRKREFDSISFELRKFSYLKEDLIVIKLYARDLQMNFFLLFIFIDSFCTFHVNLKIFCC